MANKLTIFFVLICQIALAQNNKFEVFATEKYESQNHCIRHGNSYLFFGQKGNDTLNVGNGNSLWVVKADPNLVTFESINFATHDTTVYPWSVIPLNNNLYVWSVAKTKSGISFPCVWVLDSNLALVSTQYFTNCLPGSKASYLHMAVLYSKVDSQFVGNALVEEKPSIPNDQFNSFFFTQRPNKSVLEKQFYELNDTNFIGDLTDGSGIGEYGGFDTNYFFKIRRSDFGINQSYSSIDIKYYNNTLLPIKIINPEIKLNGINNNFNITGRIGDYKVIGDNVFWVGFVFESSKQDFADSTFYLIQKVNLKTNSYQTSTFTKKFTRNTGPSMGVPCRPAMNQSIDFLNNNFYLGANESFDNNLLGRWVSTMVIAKFDTALNLDWEKQITNKNYYLNGIKALPNGGCLVFGRYKEFDKGAFEPEPFLYVLNEFGNITGTSNIETTKENAILLYPNPAQTSLSIYGLNTNVDYEISLLNLNGQILNQQTNASTIDISILAVGAYIVLIESKEGVVYKKLIKN